MFLLSPYAFVGNSAIDVRAAVAFPVTTRRFPTAAHIAASEPMHKCDRPNSLPTPPWLIAHTFSIVGSPARPPQS